MMLKINKAFSNLLSFILKSKQVYITWDPQHAYWFWLQLSQKKSGGDLSVMFNIIFNLTFEWVFLLSLPLAELF